MSPNQKIVVGVISILVIVSAGVLYFKPKNPSFCFSFAYNMQFGDRVVENPVNQGFLGPGGVVYYPAEIKALQTALKYSGFYIDPYEETGGGVYMGGFFGPSTQTALKEFQKKNGLEPSGEVRDGTVDRLNELYGCKNN